MSQQPAHVEPCPVCNGPFRGIGDPHQGHILESWQQTYHGPAGHTIAIRLVGEWHTFRCDEICAGCYLSNSTADWTGTAYMLHQWWWDEGDMRFALACDAVVSGQTHQAAAATAGMSSRTFQRRKATVRKKYGSAAILVSEKGPLLQHVLRMRGGMQ